MSIIPTRRLYFALASVIVILLIGQVVPEQARIISNSQLFWTGNLSISLLFLFDLVLTFRTGIKALSVQREMSQRFSIGRENPVTISVESLSKIPLQCRLTDDYPQQMICKHCDFTFTLAPGEKKELLYQLTPSSKGVYQFGAVYVRFKSQLGFFERQKQFMISEEIKVYSDLKGLSELYVQLGSTSALGEIQRQQKGQGTNFAALTEYVIGKDSKKIDWKATARAQRPIIREYDREEEQRLLILVDAGRMMVSELGGLSKFDHALNAALSLSLAALALNDQVGLGIFADVPLAYLPPRRGRSYLQKFLDVSAGVTARVIEPDYINMLAYFASRQKGRTLLVLLTDLIDTWGSRSLLTALTSLRQKHLTFCVVLADERVQKIAQPSLYLNQEPAYTAVLERAVATDLLSQRQLALDVLQRQGCLVLNSAPEQLSSRLIASYLDIKKRALL